ncbi:hypothetical protein [Mesorhizobium kowhaii]|uniref:Uncharacterized protein n=1 Tax=Mesorhizobium kowhaii TaxID=1300272 RepID=A0A2W7BUU2_9HYPH|nr:hypothetical protein [Mesorhizobium kowhaii]PZV34337.1 hypothetical protein B5V02_32850 [Mesorhizobium kowhaii]
MKGDKIPDEGHLIRSVPFSKLRKADGTDDVIGILPEAFAMRDVDSYLSATWLEHFAGSDQQKVTAAVHTLRNSSLKISPKSGFARGKAGDIRTACSARGHSVRIVHEPEPDNDAHAAVRRYPRDELELYEVLATGAWSHWFLNADIP